MKESIAKLKRAGITFMIMTSDLKQEAEAVAQ